MDRELQSKELGRIMAASYPRPVIFLGYVVTKPHAVRREFPFGCLLVSSEVIDTPFDLQPHPTNTWLKMAVYMILTTLTKIDGEASFIPRTFTSDTLFGS